MLSLSDVLSLSPNASEDELRSKGLLPQPAPAAAPSAILGSVAAPAAPAADSAVAKMTPPVVGPPEAERGSNNTRGLGTMTPLGAPTHGTQAEVDARTQATPQPGDAMKPMGAPEGADLGIKPMTPPTLDFHERQALPTTSAGVAPGSSEFYANKIDRLEDQKANPWGTPENHPGPLGKVGHILGMIGNIAGNATIPGTMANIPGTEMNRNAREAVDENRLAGAKKEEAAETEAKARNDVADRQATTAEEAEQAKKPLYDAQAQKDISEAIAALNPQAKNDFELWHQQNPHAPVEEWLKTLTKNKPATAEADTSRATQLRADVASGKTLTPEDSAWLKGHTQEKTIVPATNFNLNQPNKNDARSDKSYQYSSTALDKVANPVDQITQRLGRLNDTLSQNSPQADALVAPELLSIMAGGPGSGIRMNEAEIARIVGGRSNWEGLKAAINQWSLDPTTANSITAEQRKEIRALASTVQQKLTQKQKIIDDARNGLLDSDDPKDHRKTIADTKSQLDKIDAGEAQKTGGEKETANVPDGKVSVFDPQGKEHFVLKEKKDAFLKDPKYKGWSASAPAKPGS
jgi:hypothetical protein